MTDTDMLKEPRTADEEARTVDDRLAEKDRLTMAEINDALTRFAFHNPDEWDRMMREVRKRRDRGYG